MVKCADCGYLGLENPHSNELQRAGRHAREKATIRIGDRNYVVRFVCKLGARCFQDMDVPKGHRPSVEGYAPVDRDQIQCDQFVDWIEGKTPEEHESMLLQDRVKELEQTTARKNETVTRFQFWAMFVMSALAIIIGLVSIYLDLIK